MREGCPCQSRAVYSCIGLRIRFLGPRAHARIVCGCAQPIRSFIAASQRAREGHPSYRERAHSEQPCELICGTPYLGDGSTVQYSVVSLTPSQLYCHQCCVVAESNLKQCDDVETYPLEEWLDSDEPPIDRADVQEPVATTLSGATPAARVTAPPDAPAKRNLPLPTF